MKLLVLYPDLKIAREKINVMENPQRTCKICDKPAVYDNRRTCFKDKMWRTLQEGDFATFVTPDDTIAL